MEKIGIGDIAQNGLVVGILRPTVLNKPLCPFRVGASYQFSVCVRYNDVFFYGCQPPCRYVFCSYDLCIFVMGVSPEACGLSK